MHPSTPKYIQLIEILKTAIERQEFAAHQQLPNEDEIGAKYNMSRGTVRKAIAELQRMGLVRKEQGRGTFVNEPEPRLTGFSLVEFDSYMRAKKKIPQTETLVFEIIPATKLIADQLQVDADVPVFHITQLRLASDLPVVYEERYFAQSLCSDLAADLLEQHPLHWLLIEKCQIPLLRLTHTIELTTLPDDLLDLFRVQDSVPAFSLDRLSYTRHDDAIVPAVWYQAFYRADEYQFSAQFHMSI